MSVLKMHMPEMSSMFLLDYMFKMFVLKVHMPEMLSQYTLCVYYRYSVSTDKLLVKMS